MTGWYDRATKEIEDSFDRGEITDAEFWAEISNLNAELREQADMEAEETRERVLQGW